MAKTKAAAPIAQKPKAPDWTTNRLQDEQVKSIRQIITNAKSSTTTPKKAIQLALKNLKEWKAEWDTTQIISNISIPKEYPNAISIVLKSDENVGETAYFFKAIDELKVSAPTL